MDLRVAALLQFEIQGLPDEKDKKYANNKREYYYLLHLLSSCESPHHFQMG
jgi:hypothetical protein